jgi:hypothetical protein
MTGMTGWPVTRNDRITEMTGMTGMNGMAGMTGITGMAGMTWIMGGWQWGHLYLQQSMVQLQYINTENLQALFFTSMHLKISIKSEFWWPMFYFLL